MESVLSDPTWLDWVWNLGGGNVLIHIVVQAIIALFLLFALIWCVNMLGKHVFGFDKPMIVPIAIKWVFRQILHWKPILGNKFRAYLQEQRNRPRTPKTKRQKILDGVGIALYVLAMTSLFLFTFTPNTNLHAYTTEAGGILVEIRAYRQPTDGFSFDIEFDRPASVIGVWTDMPTAKKDSTKFQIHSDPTIGFEDKKDGNRNTVAAFYPIATPDKSVYLYFHQDDLNQEQLDVLRAKIRER